MPEWFPTAPVDLPPALSRAPPSARPWWDRRDGRGRPISGAPGGGGRHRGTAPREPPAPASSCPGAPRAARGYALARLLAASVPVSVLVSVSVSVSVLCWFLCLCSVPRRSPRRFSAHGSRPGGRADNGRPPQKPERLKLSSGAGTPTRRHSPRMSSMPRPQDSTMLARKNASATSGLNGFDSCFASRSSAVQSGGSWPGFQIMSLSS